jgi:hypothetical protein
MVSPRRNGKQDLTRKHFRKSGPMTQQIPGNKPKFNGLPVAYLSAYLYQIEDAELTLCVIDNEHEMERCIAPIHNPPSFVIVALRA